MRPKTVSRRLAACSASDWWGARLKICEPLAHLARHRQVTLALVPIEGIGQRRGGFLGAAGRVQHLRVGHRKNTATGTSSFPVLSRTSRSAERLVRDSSRQGGDTPYQ
jgi:hypothetical protein